MIVLHSDFFLKSVSGFSLNQVPLLHSPSGRFSDRQSNPTVDDSCFKRVANKDKERLLEGFGRWPEDWVSLRRTVEI